jgi:hypothetical protein
MRSVLSFVLFKRLALLLFLAAGGCGHMPVMSMVKLSRVSFEKTDPELLRAAVKLPRTLRPRTQGVVLRVTVMLASGAEETHDFLLRESMDQSDVATLRDEVDDATHIFAYRFDVAEAARLSAVRGDLKRKQAGGRGGSLTIAVKPELCRTGQIPAGPVQITTYLRTQETGSYVPLTRDVDLRAVTPGRDLTAEIPGCG